jgi:hypothetical protein
VAENLYTSDGTSDGISPEVIITHIKSRKILNFRASRSPVHAENVRGSKFKHNFFRVTAAEKVWNAEVFLL